MYCSEYAIFRYIFFHVLEFPSRLSHLTPNVLPGTLFYDGRCLASFRRADESSPAHVMAYSCASRSIGTLFRVPYRGYMLKFVTKRFFSLTLRYVAFFYTCWTIILLCWLYLHCCCCCFLALVFACFCVHAQPYALRLTRQLYNTRCVPFMPCTLSLYCCVLATPTAPFSPFILMYDVFCLWTDIIFVLRSSYT